MVGRIVGTGAKTRYLIDGQEVSKTAFDKAFPDKPLSGVVGTGNWARPVISDAMGVAPRFIKAVQERNAKAGLSINYTKDGRPILTNSGERQELMRLHGLHDNNGGYKAGGPRN